MTDNSKLVNRLGLGLAPYDPRKNKPQDVGFGGLSTEYLMTVDLGQAPEGFAPADVANIPRIWWDQKGNPHVLDEANALAMALEYEQSTGERFPRFNNNLNDPNPYAGGEWAAMNRSAMGGAQSGRITQHNRLSGR